MTRYKRVQSSTDPELLDRVPDDAQMLEAWHSRYGNAAFTVYHQPDDLGTYYLTRSRGPVVELIEETSDAETVFTMLRGLMVDWTDRLSVIGYEDVEEGDS